MVKDGNSKLNNEKDFDNKYLLLNKNNSKYISESDIKPYNFRNPAKFSKQQLNILALLFENVSKDSSTTLTTITQSNCVMSVSSVEQKTYQDIVKNMEPITALNLINFNPQDGQAVFNMSLNTVRNIVQKVFGGTEAEDMSLLKDLTTIEKGVLVKVVNELLQVLHSNLVNLDVSSITLDKMESNPNFISQVAAAMEVCVNITFDLTIDDYSINNAMSIVLPFILLESMLPKLSNSSIWANSVSKNSHQEKVNKEFIEKHLDDSLVNVIAEVGTVELSLKEVSELEVGDVVMLDIRTDDLFKLYVENKLIANVSAGSHRDKAAIVIEDLVNEI